MQHACRIRIVDRKKKKINQLLHFYTAKALPIFQIIHFLQFMINTRKKTLT